MYSFQKSITGPLLVLIGIMVACNIYTLIPLYSVIGEEFSIAEQRVALGSMLFTICYAIGLLFFGPTSDRFGRKQIIIFGLFISMITTIFVTLSNNDLSLYITRGMQGFTLASFAPVSFAYSFDLFKEKQRTFWIAIINAGFLAAGIIGQLISSFVLQISSWQNVYLLFSLIYFALFVLGLVFLPKTETLRSQENAKDIVLIMFKIFKIKKILKCYMIVVTLLFSFVGFYESLSYLLSDSNENIMLIRSIGLVGAALSIFTGKLIAKFSAIKTLMSGIVLGWGSILLLILTEDALLLGIYSIFLVASIALLIPTIIHLIGTYSGGLRGKALSLYSFILLVGASLGSAVASLFPFKMVLFIMLLVFTVNYWICARLYYQSFPKKTAKVNYH